ncbi:major facilitator superfamily domain-containing protein [Colletotrichum phormii]|uniref:Major facilitator superfamily domain-containing protein n=1 Tax=Colletotrichum phormii TaxID=359342 RepID=A0AAJ0EEK0_9PEZI|nr:major facilitator superfamily domain-containing protein [Colletotrichum phormii]KAK1634045.1 major facilitator superfamily domain-containing protein [Colletotrichum phormii]
MSAADSLDRPVQSISNNDKEIAPCAETASEEPYSIFTTGEKRWISYVASFGAMFSTLSSYIYFPALVPMATDLNVSVALINLTVTSYLIVAGIAPAFMGDIADQGGRRPAYILMFTLMGTSNIGLALQNSYPALLILRMVQSAGASGSYGAAYGIVADITTIDERGSYVGSMLVFTNAAPSFGPVIAGLLTEKLSWRWIFWFLVILTGTYLLTVVTLLPETQRRIVGNGSVKTQGVHRSLFDSLVRHRKVDALDRDEGLQGGKRRYHIPNPFKCISMLFSKGNFTVILMGSITYAVKMTLQSSLSAQCIDVYNLNYLEAGLIYLPSGIGGALSSYTTGKLLDRNIQKVSVKQGRDSLYRRGDNISDFPIEEARLAGIYMLVTLSSVTTAGYGVSLMQEVHIAVPMIMQFISGATTSSIFTICGTLLTDLNPKASATVQASYNLVRCIGAGAAIAAQQPLTNATGLGWSFGMFSLIMLFAAPLAMLLEKRGLGWRACAPSSP